ncbi:MAG: DUF3108 domain-containing protein [Bacteroidales bacterium]|nr:DUF3108 domain-containing protein [Bacteroidales bacterium]MCL2133799.1 DUF3108 domain-containing protein [Bacteroidales bacterium]
MKRQYILLLCCMLFRQTAFAQPTTTVDAPKLKTYTADDLVFKTGERLTLVANYRWGIINSDVGEATMLVEQESFRDTSYFVARAYATTYKFWDNFFKVRDVYEGRFDMHTLRPLYFYRDIHEGDYKMVNTIYFNNDNYTIKASAKREKYPRRDTVLQGTAATFDFISLFYNSRNIDFSTLSVGKTYPFSFVVDDEMFDLYYRFIGREEKNISGLGRFRCLKFAAKLVAGEVFKGDSEVTIWITDDENRIPLLFESPVRVGTVSARLSKYANLKYPLTSKIK